MRTDTLQQEVSSWAEETFNHTELGIAAHLLAEAAALYRAAGGTEEIAHDIVLMEFEPNKPVKSVRERSADVGILDLTMAGFLDYSLEDAIVDKMNVNRKRHWQTEPNRLGFAEHVRERGGGGGGGGSD